MSMALSSRRPASGSSLRGESPLPPPYWNGTSTSVPLKHCSLQHLRTLGLPGPADAQGREDAKQARFEKPSLVGLGPA